MHFKNQSSVVIFTFCIFSINFSMTTVWAIDGYIPSQIYFWLLIITKIGEMISCPIIYCFNHEKFMEFKRIICCLKDSHTSSKIISSDVVFDESDLSGLSEIIHFSINLYGKNLFFPNLISIFYLISFIKRK